MRDEEIEEISDKASPAKARKFNRTLWIAGVAAIALVVLGVAVTLYLRGDNGAGQPVSSPRTVTFGDNNQMPNGTAGEQTLTIAPDQVERIGIKLETVGETLSSEATAVAATGVVQANSYNETPVIPLLGGVIRRVNGELGQTVSKGQILAVIFSDEFAASQSRYLALVTEAQTARQNYDRTAKLVQLSPVSNAELDQALARLKTVQADLEEGRKRYDRTVKLVQIGAASREELEQATTKLRTSEADVEEAKKRNDRAIAVAKINPVSRSEFEMAAVKRQTAESELAAAGQRLILLGLSSQRLNALRSASQITSEIAVTAPVSGTITKRDVNLGMIVEPNKELMSVTNLATVWVIAQVYEKDIPTIRNGTGASVTTDAYPERIFRGRVTYIDPNLSSETRTAQVRVELENPGQILKIGMYVNAAFGSTGTAERTMPVIPTAAVQNMNDRQVVFVATEKPNIFNVKTVRLGPETNGRFTVLEGLFVGDRVVTDGSFLLRAELSKQDPTHH